MSGSIVSVEWLNENLTDPELILLDASLTSAKSGSDSINKGLQITSARTIDLKNVFSRQDTDLPNMLPNAKQFEQACRNIGIQKSSKIVVYDNRGMYFSPRIWWMFKTMGHDQVFVLDGGFPSWIANGYATESINSKTYKSGNFCATYNSKAVKSFKNIQENISKQECILIDARSSGRFNALAPEPRKGLRSGNIKNSVNLPFDEVLANGKLKSKKELVEIFSSLQLDKRPLIFTCGSGVTACIILLASTLVLKNETAIYDGSWTEWATRT